MPSIVLPQVVALLRRLEPSRWIPDVVVALIVVVAVVVVIHLSTGDDRVTMMVVVALIVVVASVVYSSTNGLEIIFNVAGLTEVDHQVTPHDHMGSRRLI
jgi:uncharacterized membrane protein